MSQASILNSTVIANRDAVPLVLSNPNYARSQTKSTYGFVLAVTADTTSSVYRMVQIPSNARVTSIKVVSDALSTSAAINVGVYYSNTAKSITSGASLGGAAISATFFCSALSVSSALALTDETNQASNMTIPVRQQPLWQAVGLATDPECYLDIVITPSSAITTGGNIGIEANYVE